MRFGSVCSGIEAASVAWHSLGWRAAWLAEIEPFPSAVLAHHYPQVPNLGDMTRIARRVLTGEVEAPDVLAGGTPCQAFSVAGLRESLADERGNLALKFVELLDAIDHVRVRRGDEPVICVWENVPGVLSTKDNAFGCFLAGLAGEDDALQPPGGRWSDGGGVYGPQRAVAWRTLDAQYFGLAQRRRRVFVVASARAGFDPAQVLFEWEGVRRDTAPRREAGQGAAGCLTARAGRNGGSSNDDVLSGRLIAFGGNNTADPSDVATALNACASASGRLDFDSETFITHSLRGEGFDASEDGTGRGTPLVPVAFHPTQDPISSAGMCHTLGANANATAAVLAFDTTQITSPGNVSSPKPGDACHPLAAGAHAPAIALSARVRRLTPTECERLMGFPDGYTTIPLRGKPASECPDGPRYRALGNSWAVPVARWVGERIARHSQARRT